MDQEQPKGTDTVVHHWACHITRQLVYPTSPTLIYGPLNRDYCERWLQRNPFAQTALAFWRHHPTALATFRRCVQESRKAHPEVRESFVDMPKKEKT